MQIHEVMSGQCAVVDASDTILHAARVMSDVGVGFLPVQSEGRLVGVLTDRDIVLRAFGLPDGLLAVVRDAMTKGAHTCSLEDEIRDVLSAMAALQLRRMPVLDRQNRTIGVITFSDAARFVSAATAGAFFCGITAPNDVERACDLTEAELSPIIVHRASA